jgi:hypothetical protein
MHLPGLGVVEADVGDQVTDDRERPQRRHRDGLLPVEHRHARHAHQPRPAVDLRRAGTALARLAVPAHGEVGRLGGLEAVDDVEHHLALVDLDLEVLQAAAAHVPAPHLEVGRIAAHS